MDDNCGEWLECMGVASGCGEQEVGVASGSGWNLWVWRRGVVVRRYIDFIILLIPTPLVSVLFYSSIPTFCSLKKNVFRSCSRTFFVITFYVLNTFSHSINTHTGNYSVPRQPYEGCTYCFTHEEAHANVRFLSCDGHQLYECMSVVWISK